MQLRATNDDMARRYRKARNPLFRKRWFSDDVIVLSVSWYLRFKLSYRDLALMLNQVGICVAPSTVLRWVVRYAPDLAKCWEQYEKPVGKSWAMRRDLH